MPAIADVASDVAAEWFACKADVTRPEFQKYLAERFAEARTNTPEELTVLIKQDMARWGEVVRKSNIPM